MQVSGSFAGGLRVSLDFEMRVTVKFEWRSIGALRVELTKLRFPDVADVPGIYRFDLGDRVYIGEADRLRRRFQHYRTTSTPPTPTTHTACPF